MGGKRPARGAIRLCSVPAGLSADGAGVVPRRHPAEPRVRSFFVVVAPPGFERGAGVGQRSEQRLVQQLVPQPAVEALVVAVLLRLARRHVMPAVSSAQPRMELDAGSGADVHGSHRGLEVEIAGAVVRVNGGTDMRLLSAVVRALKAAA